MKKERGVSTHVTPLQWATRIRAPVKANGNLEYDLLMQPPEGSYKGVHSHGQVKGWNKAVVKTV